jgi:hypothetical protein
MDLRTVASKVVGEMANSAVPFSGPLAESLVQELLGAQDEQIGRAHARRRGILP